MWGEKRPDSSTESLLDLVLEPVDHMIATALLSQPRAGPAPTIDAGPTEDLAGYVGHDAEILTTRLVPLWNSPAPHLYGVVPPALDPMIGKPKHPAMHRPSGTGVT